jgi:hypothetical protein
MTEQARLQSAGVAAGRLADLLGSMLAFVGGVLLGRLGAGALDLAGWGALSFTIGVAAAAVVLVQRLPSGTRAAAPAAEAPATATADASEVRHHFQLRSRRLVYGALVVGLAATALGLHALGLHRFAPAIVAGPAVLVACVALLAGPTLRRQVRVVPGALEIRDGAAGPVRTLPFAEIRRVLCDARGAVMIDAGHRKKNLLLPAAASGWSTFYVTDLDRLAAALEQGLGERFVRVDGVMPALRRLARGEEPLPPGPDDSAAKDPAP